MNFIKEKCPGGKGHGGEASKSEAGTRDRWDSSRIWKQKYSKNFLGQRITQMIRSAFENDNSDNNVEVGGGESRWEIRTP